MNFSLPVFDDAVKWFGARAPNRGPVLDSLSENDTVMVDGLSLLLKALKACGFPTAKSYGLSEESTVPACAALKPLLWTELVERTLIEIFQEVPDSVCVHVAFFRRLEAQLEARSPSLALANLALKRHLAQVARGRKNLAVRQYADWSHLAPLQTEGTESAPATDVPTPDVLGKKKQETDDFAVVLSVARPSVFLMDSGRFWVDSSPRTPGGATPMAGADSGRSVALPDANASLLLHYIDLQLYMLGYPQVPVAYMDGMESLRGYVETPLFGGAAKEIGRKLSAALRSHSHGNQGLGAPVSLTAPPIGVLEGLVEGSDRARIAVLAASMVPLEMRPLAALAVLSTVALDALKLDERREVYSILLQDSPAVRSLQARAPHGLSGDEERVASSFLERVWTSAVAKALLLLDAHAKAPISPGPELFDGLLFSRLAAILLAGHPLSLPAPLEATTKGLLAQIGLDLPARWEAPVLEGSLRIPHVPEDAKCKFAVSGAEWESLADLVLPKQGRGAWAPLGRAGEGTALPPMIAKAAEGLEDPRVVAALIATDLTPETTFLRDLRHWHSARLVTDPLATSKEMEAKEKERVWTRRDGTPMTQEQIQQAKLRRKQKEATFMEVLAASLKCAHFSSPIVPSKEPWTSAKPSLAPSPSASSLASSSASQKKAKAPSKKDVIIQQNKKAQEAKASGREVDAVASVLVPRILHLMERRLDFFSDLQALEDRVLHDPSPATVVAVAEPYLALVTKYLRTTAKETGTADLMASGRHPHLVKLAARAVHVADQAFKRGLAPLARAEETRDRAKDAMKRLFGDDGALRALFELLGFEAHFRMLRREAKASLGKEEGEKDLGPRPDVAFQMRHMGPLLERDVDVAPDPRVPFVPDAWQRDLLDAVDRQQSALVVAPTSAGKTFICYYVVEKLLRHEPPESMVVYVAPTKALVNQVAAEMHARFKTYRPLKGEATVGVFTRDWRRDAENCRVLVTIPQCLDILLMHPEHGPGYNKRIKYVIFDEVHNVSEEGGTGEVLQRLLQLTEAPFLALSATVGHPEVFHRWLQDISGDRRDVLLVSMNKRWVQGQAWTYAPPSRDVDEGQSLGVEAGKGDGLTRSSEEQQRRLAEELHAVHPLACVPAPQFRLLVEAHGLSLNPREVLELWEAMRDVAGEAEGEGPGMDLEGLSPEAFFASERLLNRRLCSHYASTLLKVLGGWLEADLALYEAVVARLAAPLDKAYGALADLEGSPGAFSSRELPELLVTLKNADKLPCLVFHFAKKGCEKLAMAICAAFKKEGAPPPEKVEEIKAKLRQARADETAAAEMLRDLEGSARTQDVAKKSLLEGVRSEARSRCLLLEGQLRGATLNPQGLDLSEYTWVTDALLEKGERYVLLLKALRLGVGIHHAGLPKKYTDLVELLFRERRLQVVVATGTLSQGVNMPARTVVLAGDSMYLTPSMYRQTAGRAGRRGQDNEAHTIFLGLPRAKIERLVASSLTPLKAKAPVRVSTVLRMCLQASTVLAKGGKDADRVISSLARIVRKPFTGASPQATLEVAKLSLHQLLYSVRYLKEAGLLTAECAASNISFLVSHVHYHGEGIFAFTRLLCEGYLDQLAALPLPNDVLEGAFVHLVALLFNRVHATPFTLARLALSSDSEARGSSLVLLPGLDEFAAFWDAQIQGFQEAMDAAGLGSLPASVAAYNRHLEGLLVQYLRDIATGAILQYELPLSNTTLQLAAPSTSFLSPIAEAQGMDAAALTSGSAAALLTLARHSVPFEASFLPLFEPREYQSAYIFDFYRNGSLQNVVTYNGVAEYTAWESIKDAHLLLLSVAASLEHVEEALGAEGKELPEGARRLVRVARAAATTFGDKFRSASNREGI